MMVLFQKDESRKQMDYLLRITRREVSVMDILSPFYLQVSLLDKTGSRGECFLCMEYD